MGEDGRRGGPPRRIRWRGGGADLTGHECLNRKGECGEELEQLAGTIIDVRGELLDAYLSIGGRGVPAVCGPADELACGPGTYLGELADGQAGDQADDSGKQDLTDDGHRAPPGSSVRSQPTNARPSSGCARWCAGLWCSAQGRWAARRSRAG